MNAAAPAMLADILDRWDASVPQAMPATVLALAACARTAARGGIKSPARSRTLTRSGRWLVVHGTWLPDAVGGRVAAIIEPAHSAELWIGRRRRERACHVSRIFIGAAARR